MSNKSVRFMCNCKVRISEDSQRRSFIAKTLKTDNIFLSALILTVLCFSSCNNGSSSKKAEGSVDGMLKDNTYLFDGRSLQGWEVTNFGPQGPVYVSGDDIILSMGDGCTGITWKGKFPTKNYQVLLEARRKDGNDFFCGMTFPAGNSPCTLIVGGWGGTVVGLSSINGEDASENETSLNMSFEKDRWYHIDLRVTDSKIVVRIDNQIVIDFTIDDNVLSIRPEVELSKPFGIASWRTTAALRNIRLLPLSADTL